MEEEVGVEVGNTGVLGGGWPMRRAMRGGR